MGERGEAKGGRERNQEMAGSVKVRPKKEGQ
jgi:hypothetical protein